MTHSKSLAQDFLGNFFRPTKSRESRDFTALKRLSGTVQRSVALLAVLQLASLKGREA
jgi:hypothetical protein